MVMTAATRLLRLRRVFASVAAPGCRKRFSSALSAEEKTRMEKAVEDRVRASMEVNFDIRVRDIVKSEVRGLIRSEAESINAGLDINLVLENAARKQALSFQKQLDEQKLHFEEKLKQLQKGHEAACSEAKAHLHKLKDECTRRADVVENKADQLQTGS